MFATVGGFALSVFFKFLPRLVDLQFLAASGFSYPIKQDDGTVLYEIPFLDRMGFVFLIAVFGMVLISNADRNKEKKGLSIDKGMFKFDNAFGIGAGIVVLILTVLYAYFW